MASSVYQEIGLHYYHAPAAQAELDGSDLWWLIKRMGWFRRSQQEKDHESRFVGFLRHLSYLVLGLSALALVSIVAVFSRNTFRQHRSAEAAVEIAQLREEGNLPAALERAQKAYIENPNDLELTRHLAELLVDIAPAKAAFFWNQLIKRHAVSDAHAHARWIESLLAVGDKDSAEEAAQISLAAHPEDGAVLAQVARLRADSGTREGATTLWKKASDQLPEDLSIRLGRSRHLISLADPAQQRDGWNGLIELAKGEGDTALEALLLLANKVPSEEKHDRAVVGAALRLSESGEPLGKCLEALSPVIHRHPEWRQELIPHLLSADPVDPLSPELASWFNAHGASPVTIDKLSREVVDLDPRYIEPYAQALLENKHLDELAAFVEDSSVPLMDSHRELINLHLKRARGEALSDIEVEDAWQTSRTENRRGMSLVIAKLAEGLGHTQLGSKAYRELRNSPAQQVEAYEGLYRIAIAAGSTEQARKVAGEAANKIGGSWKQTSSYLNLLYGAELESTTAQVWQNHDAEQENQISEMSALLAALAHYRVGQKTAALITLKNITNQQPVINGHSAMIAALLTWGGEPEQAQALMSGQSVNDLQGLLPEERAIIERYLR